MQTDPSPVQRIYDDDMPKDWFWDNKKGELVMRLATLEKRL